MDRRDERWLGGRTSQLLCELAALCEADSRPAMHVNPPVSSNADVKLTSFRSKSMQCVTEVSYLNVVISSLQTYVVSASQKSIVR